MLCVEWSARRKEVWFFFFAWLAFCGPARALLAAEEKARSFLLAGLRQGFL